MRSPKTHDHSEAGTILLCLNCRRLLVRANTHRLTPSRRCFGALQHQMKSHDHSSVEGQFLFQSLTINHGGLNSRPLMRRVRLRLTSGYLFDSHYFAMAKLRFSLSIYHVIFTSCGIRMFVEVNFTSASQLLPFPPPSWSPCVICEEGSRLIPGSCFEASIINQNVDLSLLILFAPSACPHK